MEYSKSGLSLTEGFEGYRSTAYQDVGGVWTIGFGHTAGVYEGMSCTRLQAEQWLLDDVQDAEDTVNRTVGVALSQEEFDSLVDFVFNVGSEAFRQSTMLRLLNRGNYADAALEFPKWDHVHGQVVADLLKRRTAEQQE